MYSIKNLVKQKTFLKNSEKTSSVYLIITNSLWRFQNTNAFEMIFFYFHILMLMILKHVFTKEQPKVLYFWQNKHFCNDLFRSEHEIALSKYEFDNGQNETF